VVEEEAEVEAVVKIDVELEFVAVNLRILVRDLKISTSGHGIILSSTGIFNLRSPSFKPLDDGAFPR